MTTIQMIALGLWLSWMVACSPSPEVEFDDGQTDSYIVVFQKDKVDQTATHLENERRVSMSSRAVVSAMLNDVAERHELPPARQTYSVALQGGLYHMSKSQAKKMMSDPMVAYVEKDQMIQVSAVSSLAPLALQSQAPWGLDRLDQISLPLNQTYNFLGTASNVHVYVIDTGILTTHQEFGGRASSGADLVDQDADATDCNGHGTHVAGSIGSGIYGVAKGVKLHAVRVLNCAGSGSFSTVIAGIEWVTANHMKPAIANMSLGGGISQAVDDAVTASIQAGVTYVVAAGNENSQACNSSPARVPTAITVGSTTSTDARSSFSNYGNCVSVFAPGSDILSTWIGSPTATNTISGTSMASPHVAGVAALYAASHPTASPAAIKQALLAGSLAGKVTNAGSGSPNLLINTGFLNSGGDDNSEEPPVNSVIPLQNPGELKNLQGSDDSVQYFLLNVPLNSENLVFDLSGGNGDADLYVKFGEKPSRESYTCRPYKSGNVENCSITNPQAGTWYVMLHGYDAYSGVSLKSSFSKKNDQVNPCMNCTRYSGQLSAKGQLVYLPGTLGTQVGSGTQKIWMQGPAGTDFDLYLYQKSGTSWTQVASSTSTQSIEQINYAGATGVYRVKVSSYSGSGQFDLWIQSPAP